MTDALIREVDDDVRAERVRQFWRRYRRPLLLAIVLLIVGTAGVNIWRDYQTKKAGEAMASLDAAIFQLDRGDAKSAAQSFAALAKNNSGERHDVALLWQGRAEAQAGNAQASVDAFTRLASHPMGRDLVWRDLACLRLFAANADTPKDCVSPSASPLRSQRLEWQAALLWSQGKTDDAKKLLSAIAADETTPPTQRDRVKRLLRSLPAKAA